MLSLLAFLGYFCIFKSFINIPVATHISNLKVHVHLCLDGCFIRRWSVAGLHVADICGIWRVIHALCRCATVQRYISMRGCISVVVCIHISQVHPLTSLTWPT